MTLFSKEPLPAPQQVLHRVSIRRSWCKPLLQSYESARLVLADVDGKKRLSKSKCTCMSFIGNGEPPELPLLLAPLAKLRRISRFGQRFHLYPGEGFNVPVQRRDRGATIKIRQMTDNLIA